MAVIARAEALLNSESKRKRNMQQQNPRQLAAWGGSASSDGLVEAQGAGLQLVEEEAPMVTILTIGYEGSTIEDFIATLTLADVRVLIDIRDVPVSRKRGFSKKALSMTLEGAGIGYVHLRDLGDPKPGRDAAKRGDMQTFERIFRTHLEGSAAQKALEQAISIASGERVCLLCFERDHSGCHRAIVAEEMAGREAFQIRHLGVRHGLAKEEGDGDFERERAYAFG